MSTTILLNMFQDNIHCMLSLKTIGYIFLYENDGEGGLIVNVAHGDKSNIWLCGVLNKNSKFINVALPKICNIVDFFFFVFDV